MQVPMTPVRILERGAVKLYPDKTAVVDGHVRLTYETYDFSKTGSGKILKTELRKELN